MSSLALANSSADSEEPFDWSSPYPLPVIIVAGLICAALSIVTVVGNLMVMISFYIDKNIRQASNYFIFSLAVSDFLIGLEGFPLYSIYALHGEKWTMGWFLCDLWLSVDYTVCLASTYTVLFITIDRYCSVKIPTTYRSWRTQQKVLIIIAITWIVPALLFFISVFGWGHFTGKGRLLQEHECMVQFMVDPYFNMSMYISYYWSTLVVMIILYAGIYRAARELHLKSKKKRQQFQAICALRATTTPITLQTSSLKHDDDEFSQVTPDQSNESSDDKNVNQLSVESTRNTLRQKSPFRVLRRYSRQKTSPQNPPAPSSPIEEMSIDETLETPPLSAAGETITNEPIDHEVHQQSSSLVTNGMPAKSNSASSSSSDSSSSSSSSELSNNSGGKINPSNDLTSGPDQKEKRTSLPASILKTFNGADDIASFDSLRSSRIKSLNLDNLNFIDVDFPSLRSPEEFFILDIGMKEDISPKSSQGYQEEQETVENDKKESHDLNSAKNLKAPVKELNAEAEITHISSSSCEASQRQPCEWETALRLSPERISSHFKDSVRSSHVVARGQVGEKNQSSLIPHKDMIKKAGILYHRNGNQHSWTLGKFQMCWEYHPSFFKSTKVTAPTIVTSTEVTNEEVKKSDNSNDTTHLLPCCNIVNTTKTKVSKLCWRKARSNNAGNGTDGRRVSLYKKSKSENRARKALRTITFILGAFVLFWTPFYVLATIYGFCDYCVPKTVYVISYYMCYMNSPINPFCYAMANAQFKKTLSRMLRGDFHRT